MNILFRDSEVGFDKMSILELRKTILGEVMTAYTTVRKSPLDWYDKTRACKQYNDIAVIVRRGSEDDVREICRYIANDPDNIDSFIEEKLVNVTTDEPADMYTIDHMNMVLDTITGRYKTYATTGDLDPLLDKLTTKQLLLITLNVDRDNKVEPDMFDTWAVMLRSIMFIDEILMFCEAPDSIGKKFLLSGVNMIAKTGAPVRLKEEVNAIVNNMTTKEDIK